MTRTVECMLAASEIPKEDDIGFPVMVSLKYDGMRYLQMKDQGMSRKMLPFENKSVQEWAVRHAEWLDGLDGEIIVGPPNLQTTFNTTTSGITKEAGWPDFKLYVVDTWSSPDTAEERYEQLREGIAKFPEELADRIVLVEQIMVKDIAHLQRLYIAAVKAGYEGLILKHPKRKYKNGRSTLNEGILLKWKEFKDSEIKIESVKQGKSNKNVKTRDELGKAKRSTHAAGKVLTEMVGAFIGKDINPLSPFFGKTITVGPGNFKKDELVALWAAHQDWLVNPQKLTDSPVVGRVMTYKYQVSGVKDLPRYPGSKGFRSGIDL